MAYTMDSISCHNPPKKAKRNRTSYTESQIKYLQERFTIDSNPDGNELEKIASRIGLKKRVVQVWFQNNRARLKKTANNSKGCNQEISNHSTSNGTTATSLPDDFSFDWGEHSIDTPIESQGYSNPSSPPLQMLLPSQAGSAHYPSHYNMGNVLGGAGPTGAQAAGSSSAHIPIQGQNLNGENNGCPSSSRLDQVSPHDSMGPQPNNRSPDISKGAMSSSGTHESEMAAGDQISSHTHLGQDRLQHYRGGEDICPEHFYGENSSTNGNATSSSFDLHQHYLQAYNLRSDPNPGAMGLYNPSNYMGLPPMSRYHPYSSGHGYASHFTSMMPNSLAHLDTDGHFNGDVAALSHQFQGDNHNQPSNGNSSNGDPVGLSVLTGERQAFSRVSPSLGQFHSDAQLYRNGEANHSFSSSERSCFTEDQESP